MCQFTSHPSALSHAEAPEEKFVKTEKVLVYICNQMDQLLLRISEMSVRLDRAGALSAAGASLELQLQVLQGVYSQMHEMAAVKAEELEQLNKLI